MALFLVGCCIGLARGGRLRPRPGPSLYFFVAPYATPKRQKKSSPHVPLGRVSSEIPPPPLQPPFGWLLCLFTKRRPTKVTAPPISQFSDECLLAPKTRLRRVVSPLAPEKDSWGGAAPRFISLSDVAMKSRAKRLGVGWRSSFHVCLCVSCSTKSR